MILLLSLVIGLLAGWLWARIQGSSYRIPELSWFWLVLSAFLLQFTVVSLPKLSNGWVAAGLLTTQTLLLIFAWLNRRIAGMPILIWGVALNLLVMAANSGFMPVSPDIASQLVSRERLLDVQTGSRIGSKDILLHPQDTRFEWLADRFLTPAWFPSRAAFSLGDVLIALGAFWMLARQAPGPSIQFMTRGAQS
jgi:hypothetical protein